MPYIELGPGGPLMPVSGKTLEDMKKHFGSAKRAGLAISEAYLPGSTKRKNGKTKPHKKRR